LLLDVRLLVRFRGTHLFIPGFHHSPQRHSTIEATLLNVALNKNAAAIVINNLSQTADV